MNCPACSTPLAPSQDHCPACGAGVALPVQGALAPDPHAASPTTKAEPLREIPGLRKRERTWKDEVRDRVRDRKRRRFTGNELPLFPEGEILVEEAGAGGEGGGAPIFTEAGEQTISGPPRLELEADEADLPLRPYEETRPRQRRPVDASLDPTDERKVLPTEDPDREWSLEVASLENAGRPVERPALLWERVQAAAVDFTLLLGLWATVAYFASRAAHVPLEGLWPSWPYLAAYLALLGLAYAGYFTGTSGQTVGKILGGLRVVDSAGRPPGYARAFARAALGIVGILVALLGLLPMFMDPARRALHDRILRTRVVKK